MRILIIIPAYNEQANIRRVVDNLTENFPDYDYVVVNDGSSDRTSAICHELGYNIVDLPVNLGLSGAFETGMRYAERYGYDAAIQIDADGQHRPEFIPDMVTKLEAGYDIVIGSRFAARKKPFSARMIGSRLIAGCIRLTTGKVITDPTSGMRLYNRKMIGEFAKNLNYGPEPDTISFLIRQGARVTEVQVQMDERTEGQSYLSFTKSIFYMLRMTLSILIIQNFRIKRR